jgi:PIN domain nuclease of toxin-antitoxin system
MRDILLDTHALIWLVDDKTTHNLGKNAKHILSNSTVYASSISIAEIEMKKMNGKLHLAQAVTGEVLLTQNIYELQYKITDAIKISDFESLVGHDPFDRMLLAQARAEGMIFMTADKVLLGLGIDSVVDARL